MKVELLNYTPLWLVAHSIRMSHDSHNKSDTQLKNNYPYREDGNVGIGEKDKDLIKRIGVKAKHESVLEMVSYTFDVEMSTKTLLAFSRHRIGVSLTMRSTRYTTKKNKGSHGIQCPLHIADYAERIMSIVDEAIENGYSDDDISLLLPQCYLYRGQIQFNARSLRHFFHLRLSNHAHYQIQELARDLFYSLPKEHIETMFYDIKEEFEL